MTPVKHKLHEGWEEAAKLIGARPLSGEECKWLDFDDDVGEWTW